MKRKLINFTTDKKFKGFLLGLALTGICGAFIGCNCSGEEPKGVPFEDVYIVESEETTLDSTIVAGSEDESITDDVSETPEILETSEAETAAPVETTKPEEETTNPVETTKPEYIVTKLDKTMYAKSTVNVRKGPSTDFEKIGSLSAGKQVKVVGQSDQTGWYLIQFDGKEGYVSNSYLQDKPVETTTPKPTTTKAPSTSSGKTETTTTQPQTTQKENPNAYKASQYVIAKNPDGSYDVKNCIIGNSSSGVPREQAEMDVYYIFEEKLGNKFEVPEGYYSTIGFQRRYMLCAHFDIRDWYLAIHPEDRNKESWFWIFDENFELKKVSSDELK